MIRWPIRTRPSCRASKSMFTGVQPGAVGSVLVLLGADRRRWAMAAGRCCRKCSACSFRRSIRRRVWWPQLDPLANVATPDNCRPSRSVGAAVTVPSADALDRLYRPQALDVPVLVPRDGPIAAINPDATQDPTATASAAPVAMLIAAGGCRDPGLANGGVAAGCAQGRGRCRARGADLCGAPVLGAGAGGRMARCCLKRSSTRASTTTVPQTEQPALLRAGNSGLGLFRGEWQDLWPASAPGRRWSRTWRCRPRI